MGGLPPDIMKKKNVMNIKLDMLARCCCWFARAACSRKMADGTAGLVRAAGVVAAAALLLGSGGRGVAGRSTGFDGGEDILRDVNFLYQRRISSLCLVYLVSLIRTKCEVEGMMNSMNSRSTNPDRGCRWRGNPCRKEDPSAAAEVRGDMKQTLPRTSSCEIKTTCSIQDVEADLRPWREDYMIV